jgi:phosphopantothenate synthetase
MTLSRFRWKPLCEKKLAGPTQHTATAPNFLISHTRGRHLRYLIGQQRSQSSPHANSKSSSRRKKAQKPVCVLYVLKV